MSNTNKDRFSNYAGMLMIVTLLVYIISWLAPVAEGVPNGYDAYTSTYKSLFTIGQHWQEQSGFLDKITIALADISPHTNYIFVIAMLLLLFNRQGMTIMTMDFLEVLLVLSFVANLSWIYGFYHDDKLNNLHVGYYLWAASFLLAAITMAAHISGKKASRAA